MRNARDPDWLKHVFKYQHQLRADEANGRGLSASDVETIKLCAALVLSEQRPSAMRIARESVMLQSKKTIQRSLGKLSSGVLHQLGAGWTTGAPTTWQNYRPHAVVEPTGIERQVSAFIRDLETRIADLVRRQPKAAR